ncbi:MAG: ACP S-malonyltransferase [Candidatus Cloacimonetes bacterium]|nr:ACP S-malonyltransferase [Candidatus Cloacimonadota bacterium]
MRKIAYIFPGQGAQYVGMSRELIEADSENIVYLEKFKARTGYDLQDIMLNGPEEKLKETRFTQPAILFHSIAALRLWQKESSITPDFVAGHSLGEFSALVASGVLELSDAMYLVHKRGEFMIRASAGAPFGMTAIIGLAPEKVEELCEQASEAGIVIAANFNTPVQTVISGSEAGVQAAMALAESAGAKRIIPLVVGGAFHSPLVAEAAQWLEEEMADIDFKSTDIPVVSNVDALPWTDSAKIKENLAKQVTSSVRWVESVNYMSTAGVGLFIEFGPQKVLGGMLRKIDKNLTTMNLEKPEDIGKLIELINNGEE